MKSGFIVCLFLLAAGRSFGQFAFVCDKDGYVNVRDSANARGRIVDTLCNGHLVYRLENGPRNWLQVDFSKKEEDIRYGFVSRDRLKSVDSYDSIPMLDEGDMNTAVCNRDSIRVVVKQEKFDPTKYRLTYENREVTRVNGKQYWGTDGERPKREYRSISLQIGRRRLELSQAALDNLFEPTLDNTKVYYDRQNDILYIVAENSDGAGGYAVAWRVIKGEYSNRFIMYGF